MEAPTNKSVSPSEKAYELKKAKAKANRIWWSGMGCLILGAVGNIVAVNYGNVILLSSSSSFNLIFSCLLSVIILEETINFLNVISMMVICVGSICCILSAKSSSSQLTGDNIDMLFTSRRSLIYISILVTALVCSITQFQRMKRTVEREWKAIFQRFTDKFSSKYSCTNIMFRSHFLETDDTIPHETETDISQYKLKNVMKVFQSLTDKQKQELGISSAVTSFQMKLPLFTMMTCSGILVSLTTCFIKVFTTHLSSDGLSWGFAIFASLTICSAVCQLKFLNLGMELYE